MTDDELIKRAAQLVKVLESRPNASNRHRIEIVEEISRVHLGEREPLVSLKKAFRCLACGILMVRAQCPRSGCRYRVYPPWQTCGFRFFCDPCATWCKDRQMKAWLELTSNILKTPGLNLSSGARFEWKLQDNCDGRNGSRFGQHVRHTLQPGLDPPWMLLTAIDPLRGSIRGLYLGNSRVASRGKGNDRVVSIGSKVYGNNSVIWLPETWPFVPPRPDSLSAASELLRHLQWTVNAATERSCVLPADVPVAQAIRVHKAYRGRRLYAVHGLAYGVQARDVSKKSERAELDLRYCPDHHVRLSEIWEFPLAPGEHERCSVKGNREEMGLNTFFPTPSTS